MRIARAPRVRPLQFYDFSPDGNGENSITLNDCVERRITADDAADNRVVTVEMRLRRRCDEILAAARVGTRECHAERAALISSWIHLIANSITGTAVSVVAWIAVLRNEVRNDTMEASAAIISR